MTRAKFGLVSALLLGLSVAAFAADAPARPEITKSDRWFAVSAPGRGAGQTVRTGYLHILIAPSGEADAPVRVVYEFSRFDAGTGKMMERSARESLCLNDEWLSPVKVRMIFFGRGTGITWDAAITRPDPKSTAGKLVGVMEGQRMEWPIKERTALAFAPFDIVARLPFDKEKPLEFAAFDHVFSRIEDCTLAYQGEEEVDVNGAKRRLHKFIQTGADRASASYWLTGEHELVQAALYDHSLCVPAAETEARQPIADREAEQIGAGENAAQFSEAIAGCGAIRTAMRIYFAQNNSYPALDSVTADKLSPMLQIGPTDLDGKFFKARGYVVNSTAKHYTVKAVLGAQTYVIDEKGVESGTYKTK